MAKFKIVPTNIRNGNTAPYFVEEVADEKNIEKLAATLSPLFKSKNWEPSISKLPSKPKNFNSRNY